MREQLAALAEGALLRGAACVQDVLLRMLDSVIGCFKPNFLEDIGDSGDLYASLLLLLLDELCVVMHARADCPLCRYGPFWITTTLISLTSIIGNYGVDKVRQC